MTTGNDDCACPEAESRWDTGDLDAAARLQRGLLPPSPYTRGRWSAAYRYSPAGDVGGDILDLVASGDDCYVVFADVSGKGVAAPTDPSQPFGSTRFRLNPGETLLLYSDGVTEAFDAAGQEYGSDRLRDAAAAAADRDIPSLLAHIAEDHDRFLGGAAPGDDLTMLAIRRL